MVISRESEDTRIFYTLLGVVLLLAGCLKPAVSPNENEITSTPSRTATLPPSPSPTSSVTPTVTFTPTPSITPTPTLEPLSSFQQGVTYTSYYAGRLLGKGSDTTLSEIIQPMGVNWISLTFDCTQSSNTSTTIKCEQPTTLSDGELIHVINYAHDLGMRVMLTPNVRMETGELLFVYFGQNEKAWSTYFENYTKHLTHYASLAEKHGVDSFCIGKESITTITREQEWREVIAEVRQVYSGPITYSAFYNKVDEIQWWDALDYIGVSAYYPMTQKKDPSVEELVASWEDISQELEALSKKWDRPILFTEIGYRSFDGAASEPSIALKPDYLTENIDLEEQANAYQAVFEALSGKNWWRGVYWWVWLANPLQGGLSDNGYTPNLKPAENVLRANYGAPLRQSPTPFPEFNPVEEDTLSVSPSMGWSNWSWEATVDLNTHEKVHSGRDAIKASLGPRGGLSLYKVADVSSYDWLELYINFGNTVNRNLKLYVNDMQDKGLTYRINLSDPKYYTAENLQENTWHQVHIPLSTLGINTDYITRVNIVNTQNRQEAPFYIDDIRFVADAASN